jgi:uncharacterized protein with HEPN domain
MTEGERDRLCLDHIAECIHNVRSDIAGDSSVVGRNRTIRDAVLRNLQIMAESTQRLSETIKATEPTIPWPQIEGFRHRLVHDYFRVDSGLIMRVIDEHLDELLDGVSRMKLKF